jgi:hypothetical protein
MPPVHLFDQSCVALNPVQQRLMMIDSLGNGSA